MGDEMKKENYAQESVKTAPESATGYESIDTAPESFTGYEEQASQRIPPNCNEASANSVTSPKLKRRGLSDKSKEILENWLYIHRYSPYPSAEEKLVLAELANIPMSKLSRWFTNARKRLIPDMIRSDGQNPDNFIKRRDKHIKDEPDETISVNEASNLPNPPTNAGPSGTMTSSKKVNEIPWITASAEGRRIDIKSVDTDGEVQNEYLQSGIFYNTTPSEEPVTFISSMIEQDLGKIEDEINNKSDAQEPVNTAPESDTWYELVNTEPESVIEYESVNTESESATVHTEQASQRIPSNFNEASANSVTSSVLKRSGLSDKSQDILKNWLYYHRYSPYPSAEEKLGLAKSANIPMSKLNRWFTNARKRLIPDMIRSDGHNPDNFIKRRDKHSKDAPYATISVNEASNLPNPPTNAGPSGTMTPSKKVNEIPWITASAEGRRIDIKSVEAVGEGQNEYLQSGIFYNTTPSEEPVTFICSMIEQDLGQIEDEINNKSDAEEPVNTAPESDTWYELVNTEPESAIGYESVNAESESATGYEEQTSKRISQNSNEASANSVTSSMLKRRGLSDESQDFLENWLYHHRYCPYPSAEEKLVLAESANIPMSKLSRWFTNARKRLIPDMIRRDGHNPDNFFKRREKHSKDKPDETISVNEASNLPNPPTNVGPSGEMTSSEKVNENPLITASAERRIIDIKSVEADDKMNICKAEYSI